MINTRIQFAQMEKVRHVVRVTDSGPYIALETTETNVAQCHTPTIFLKIS